MSKLSMLLTGFGLLRGLVAPAATAQVEPQPLETSMSAYPGTPEQFAEWIQMNDVTTIPSPDNRITLYANKEGLLVAATVRWPNRIYYYHVLQC